MIDPFTAFAALKGATEAISKAIKTGKDLAKMSGAVAKYDDLIMAMNKYL